MQTMKGKTESVALALEIMTPVQAGSGANLGQSLDYINYGGKVFVVDQERTFASVAAGDQVLNNVLSSSKLEDLVNLAGQRFGYVLPPLSRQPTVPDQFREQLKDAFLKPYIPGTAIKGAIRTVLLAQHILFLSDEKLSDYLSLLPIPIPDKYNPKRSIASEKRSGFASEKLLKKVFGEKPNHNLMRALHVGDAIFGQDDLRLADIRWMNLVKDGDKFKTKWRRISIFDPKDEKHFKNQDKWENANGIYAETLAPQALAPITLQWDGFLLSNLHWHSDSPIPHLLPANFDELRTRLNAHAQYRLQREIEFYGQYGQTRPKDECQRILGLITREPDAAYLQLSWGSGWRGMTGDWMNDSTEKTMRGLYPEMRGRDGMPFPKTRRLAVYENAPCLPLGWIRLLPMEKVNDRLRQKAIHQQQQASRCAWVDETMAKIMKANNSKEDEALKGKSLAEAWSQIADKSLQQAALSDIRSRWQAKGWWDSAMSGSAKKARSIYTNGAI